MENDEAEHQAGQERNVQHVEADERRLAHLATSQQNSLQEAPDPGDVVQHVRRDADGPEGELVPGQEVPRKGKPQGEQKQPETDRPVEFATEVGTREGYSQQVKKRGENHGVACPAMEGAKKGAEGHCVLEVLCAGVRFAGSGDVVDHQQNAAQGEGHEQGEGHDPQPEGSLRLQRPGRNPNRVQVKEEIAAHPMGERVFFRASAGTHPTLGGWPEGRQRWSGVSTGNPSRFVPLWQNDGCRPRIVERLAYIHPQPAVSLEPEPVPGKRAASRPGDHLTQGTVLGPVAGTHEPLCGSPDHATQVCTTAGERTHAVLVSDDKQVAVLQPGERIHLEVRRPAQGKPLGKALFEVGHGDPHSAHHGGQRAYAGHGMARTSKKIAARRGFLSGGKGIRGLLLIGLRGWRFAFSAGLGRIPRPGLSSSRKSFLIMPSRFRVCYGMGSI